jgi:uncharacterized membrane protein YcaP (DUF421 family)
VYAIVLYRLAPGRTFGNHTVVDIAMTVIIGSSLSRALTGNAPLLPVFAATFVLLVVHVLLATVALRSERVSWLVKGRPLQLIRQGKIDWANMKRAKLGERDLFEQLRLQGVARPEHVAEGWLERNGRVSVVRSEQR